MLNMLKWLKSGVSFLWVPGGKVVRVLEKRVVSLVDIIGVQDELSVPSIMNLVSGSVPWRVHNPPCP